MNDHTPFPPGRRLVIFILGLATVLVATAAGIQLGLMANRQPELRAATLYPEPRELAGFDLLDDQGRSYGIDRWHDHWRLVFFGFTHCPDICPSTLSMLRSVVNGVDDPSALKVTFVSVDPERDDPTRIGEYARYFHPDFEAVTGDHDQLLALTRQLNVVYRIEPHDPEQIDYGVDHSAAILLIDPDARLRGAFTAPHDPEAMISDLRALLGLSS